MGQLVSLFIWIEDIMQVRILPTIQLNRAVEKMVTHEAHNLKIAGSSPAGASNTEGSHNGIAAVLKTAEVKTHVGSTPTPSANKF